MHPSDDAAGVQSCGGGAKRRTERTNRRIAERYFELRETVLSEENILREFRSFPAEIPTLSYLKEIIRSCPPGL